MFASIQEKAGPRPCLQAFRNEWLRMNAPLRFFMMLVVAIAPGHALAGDDGDSCATPQTLIAGQQYDGDTSVDANPIDNIGGVFASPGNDHVYAFTASQSSGFVDIISANYGFIVYLVAGCLGSTTTAPIAYVSENAPTVLGFSGLAVGQTYYLIVSGAPDADENAENGQYSLSMPNPASGEDDGGLDCASAQELAPGQTYSGSTVKAGYPITAIGPVQIQTRSEIYSFTAGDIGDWIFADWADYGIDLYVVTDCAEQTPSAVANTENAPAALDLSQLAAGQTYYLVVTGRRQSGMDAVGRYSLSTLPAPPKPDAIFGNGFDLPDD